MEKIWKILAVDVESQIEVKNIPQGEFNLQAILNTVYALMGLVAVVAIVYNAVQYLTSQGDAGVTKKATQGLIFAAVGLGIILLATAVTNFIFVSVGGAGK